MLMGAGDIRHLGIFTEVEWTCGQAGEPVIAEHPLGKICWGMKEDEKDSPLIRNFLCSKLTSSLGAVDGEKEVTNIIARTHGITPEECETYMPHIAESLDHHCKDQLILRPDYENKSMSKNDQIVYELYRQKIQEIRDESGNVKLQLPLPWKSGRPISMPESLP